MKIRDVFKKRRSAVNFKEGFEINEIDFESIFELDRYSSSVYNTQDVRYLCVTNKASKEILKELNLRQNEEFSRNSFFIDFYFLICYFCIRIKLKRGIMLCF